MEVLFFTFNANGETEDELMLAIQVELDEIVSKEVCDSVYESAYVNPTLQGKSQEELEAECQNRKGAIMNVISSSVCMQRLYFIIRSSIMGIITGLQLWQTRLLQRFQGFEELYACILSCVSKA